MELVRLIWATLSFVLFKEVTNSGLRTLVCLLLPWKKRKKYTSSSEAESKEKVYYTDYNLQREMRSYKRYMSECVYLFTEDYHCKDEQIGEEL